MGRGVRAATWGLAASLLLVGGLYAVGTERMLTVIAGPADQGAVNPLTLSRRAKPTDSLVCSPGLCAGRTDAALPVYAAEPAALIARLDAVVLSDAGHLTRVDDGTRPLYRRYVARTKVMRFADTIDAVAVPVGSGSGLALYGRSQIGVGDWGVNRARIEAWTSHLGLAALVVPVLDTVPTS